MTTYVDSSALLKLYIGEITGIRSLDALHLAAAQQLQVTDIVFCTFDLRQGQAARHLGLRVVGC